jgi:hypothetical protein
MSYVEIASFLAKTREEGTSDANKKRPAQMSRALIFLM